jgi:hypothetical protein
MDENKKSISEIKNNDKLVKLIAVILKTKSNNSP